MTSQSSDKETETIDRATERRPDLKPIWDYKSKYAVDRESLGPTMAIAWFGIVYAIGFYPIVVGACACILAWYQSGFRFDFYTVGPVLSSSVIAFVLFALYGMLMTIPAYLLLKLIDWWTGSMISDRGACGVLGGLTGFLCTTGGGIFFAGQMDGPFRIGAIYFLVLLPLLAIVMGHVGAIWGGYHNRDTGFPFFEPLFVVEQQFTIWFLMKLTVLVAVLALICKAAGDAGLYLAIHWTFYFVVQGFLLLCDYGLQKWMKRR